MKGALHCLVVQTDNREEEGLIFLRFYVTLQSVQQKCHIVHLFSSPKKQMVY